jgi:hypothetical protein
MTKINTDQHFTLSLSATYGQDVEVIFGQISLVPARHEYDLESMLNVCVGICRASNYGGVLYAPADANDNAEAVATISEDNFTVTTHLFREKPSAPYAVYSGLPGYLPNSCDHFGNLRDALEHFAEELDCAIDRLYEAGMNGEPEDHELAAFMRADLEVVQTALRAHGEPIHPEHNIKFGYSSHVTTYEWLTLAPIAPEDYSPDQTND